MGLETYHAADDESRWISELCDKAEAILRDSTDPERARGLIVRTALRECRARRLTRHEARPVFFESLIDVIPGSDPFEYREIEADFEDALSKLPASEGNVIEGRFGGRQATAEDFDPIVTLADWVANPAPPIEWLMEGLVAKETVNLTFGKAFGGKSLSALGRALCMASGVDWQGFKVSRPLNVLYVDEEMGRPLMESRLLKMRQVEARFQSDEVGQRFKIASRAGMRLDDAKWHDTIRRLVEKHNVEHVIWDTLRRLHSKNEDRSEEMLAVFGFLDEMRRDHGPSSEVLHHAKKNGDECENWLDAVRGSGDITASCDAIAGFWKSKSEAGRFTFRADSKHAGEVAPLGLSLDPETLWFHPAGPPSVSGALDQAILEVLATCTPGQGLSTNAIFRDKRVKGRYSEVMAALGRLRNAGKVREEGEGKAHVWIIV